MGHCSSYDDVEVINSGLAREIKAKPGEVDIIIPSIIVTFVSRYILWFVCVTVTH